MNALFIIAIAMVFYGELRDIDWINDAGFCYLLANGLVVLLSLIKHVTILAINKYAGKGNQ